MIDPKRLARLFLDEWQDTEQPIQQRGTILPLGIYEDGSAHLAVPGLIQDGIEGWNALWNDAQAAREGAYPTFDVEQGKRSAGNSLMAAGLAATGGLAAGLSRAPRQSARPVGMTRNEATAPVFDAEPIPQGSGFGSMPYEARSKHWPHSWGPKDLSRWDSETIDRARKFVQREEARERWEPMVNELMWPGGGPMAMHRWEAEAKLLRDRPDLSAAADEWHSANMNFYEHTHPNWQNDRYAALNLPKYPGTPPPSTDVLRDMTLKGVLLPDGSTGADRMARLAASVDPAKSDSANLLAANPKTSALAPAIVNALEDQAPKGIRAYHGSPHDYAAERLIRWPDGRTEYIVGKPDVLPEIPSGAEVVKDFPLGRQRLDKIGTGEGAQAYGHGLYQAENEGVARSYRDTLKANTRRGAESLDASAKAVADAVGASGRIVTEPIGGNLFGVYEVEPSRFLKSARRRMIGTVEETEHSISGAKKYYAHSNEPGALDRLENPGRMYEVNINADPEDFLDWDLPLKDQPKALEAFRKIVSNDVAKPFEANVGHGITASNAYHNYIGNGRGGPESSNALREAGIPGIRYKDAMSRGGEGGTNNYVVFDDALVEILRKYANPPTAATVPLGLSGQNESDDDFLSALLSRYGVSN